MCNSGVGQTPVVDGQVYYFGVNGLSNGLAVMADKETWSLWDHITGEAFDGPLKGHKLDVWPISLTTAEAALAKYPDITISLSGYRSFRMWLFRLLHRHKIRARGTLPLPFFHTMSSKTDPRLPRMTQGLGVIVDKQTRFYPMRVIPDEGIEETWHGRILHIQKGEIDRVPYAVWGDSDEKPMQLLTRWYGFSFTYPHCTIYE